MTVLTASFSFFFRSWWHQNDLADFVGSLFFYWQRCQKSWREGFFFFFSRASISQVYSLRWKLHPFVSCSRWLGWPSWQSGSGRWQVSTTTSVSWATTLTLPPLSSSSRLGSSSSLWAFLAALGHYVRSDVASSPLRFSCSSSLWWRPSLGFLLTCMKAQWVLSLATFVMDMNTYNFLSFFFFFLSVQTYTHMLTYTQMQALALACTPAHACACVCKHTHTHTQTHSTCWMNKFRI